MLFPIGDDQVKGGHFPLFSYGFILLNLGIYLIQIQFSDELICSFGTIPSNIASGRDFYTLLTSMFLHGGWMHIIGNMWFLFIFGDNVEDRFGHVGYAIFYLASGIGASLVHLVSEPSSTIPTIGASGAIAGVMGAYFLWYRHAQVKALVPLGIFIQIMVLPAWFFLGFWFVIQFLQGTMSSAAAESAGVAWWAHIGGFGVGFGLALLAEKWGLVQPLNLQRDNSRAVRYRMQPRYRDYY